MVDAVITYVDGNDPLWQEDYRNALPDKPLGKRFRDWGTLPYLLRGIRKFMPFVDNVYLVVSRASQVPAWADTSRLKVVVHADIIPEGCLPLFNSASIEMFLHRIPGLKDRYIYFNDDFFPVSPCREDDFFRDGKAVTGFSDCLFSFNLYKRQCRNSDRMARKAAGKAFRIMFKRPQHTCASMLRPLCEELYSAHEDEILQSVSTLREDKNFNQYLFSDYFLHKGMAIDKRISNKHLSLGTSDKSKISSFLRCPTSSIVCINDVEMSQMRFQTVRASIIGAFDTILPEKSEFEK